MSHPIIVTPGSPADAAALASWHYATGRPRAITLVLAARFAPLQGVAGVLVITRPTLNGAWRAIAWPGWLAGLPRRDAARRINDELRCIARIIVDPRVRGIGVAAALLRTYLASPQTSRTECLARYGSLVPLLTRAGMSRIDVPPIPAESRLRAALATRGIHPWMLADPCTRAHLVQDADIARAWRTWAMRSRATRRFASRPDLIDRTWSRLAADRAAFVAHALPGAGFPTRPNGFSKNVDPSTACFA